MDSFPQRKSLQNENQTLKVKSAIQSDFAFVMRVMVIRESGGITMKFQVLRPISFMAVTLFSLAAFAQVNSTPTPTLKPNQTLGYGNNQLLLFTYTQSFDCA